MSNNQISCKVPFIAAFSDAKTSYRNCCSTEPQISSDLGTDFNTWWNSSQLELFRNKLTRDEVPIDCKKCRYAEQIYGKSFRTEINKINADIEKKWPAVWNVELGNKCNLACWTCSEYSSSLIEKHKKQIGMLDNCSSADYQTFFKTNIKPNILKSYEFHETVTLTLLGGEPLIITEFIDFLNELKILKLNKRTRLEIHTNGTVSVSKISKLLNKFQWQHLSIFVSIDAVNKLSEWVRYGSNWKKINQNIIELQKISNYLEIHTVLSVLNINDLHNVCNYAKNLNVPHNISLVTHPEIMNIESWDLDQNLLCNIENLKSVDLAQYYSLIGSKKINECSIKLKNYINQFDNIRKPLSQFDPVLANVLGVN